MFTNVDILHRDDAINFKIFQENEMSDRKQSADRLYV